MLGWGGSLTADEGVVIAVDLRAARVNGSNFVAGLELIGWECRVGA